MLLLHPRRLLHLQPLHGAVEREQVCQRARVRRPRLRACLLAARRGPQFGGERLDVGEAQERGSVVAQRAELLRVAQQALDHVVAVLREAGAKPEHIVRMTWYVTDKREYLAASARIGQIFRQTIGSFSIAMTAVEVSALIEDRAKVEIEVTAVVPE